MSTDDCMLVDESAPLGVSDHDELQQHHRCKRKRDDLEDIDMRVDADMTGCDDNVDINTNSHTNNNMIDEEHDDNSIDHENKSITESLVSTASTAPVLSWSRSSAELPIEMHMRRRGAGGSTTHNADKSIKMSSKQVSDIAYRHLLRKPQKPILIKMIQRRASCEDIRSYLVSHPTAVHSCDGYYGTALLSALAQAEHDELVALLLEQGADPNQVPDATEATQYDRRFVPPLFAAVLMQSMHDVVLLLNAGADPNISHMNEYHKGNIVSYLLISTATYVSKNPSSSDTSSSMVVSSDMYGLNSLSGMVSDKIQVMHLARHDPAAFVDWFLSQCEQRQKPVDLRCGPRNATNHLRMSVLHVATYLGMMALVSVLIKHGISIDTVCEGGYTPLHFAAMRDMSAMVQYLIMNCGANPNVRSKNQYAAQATELAAPHAKRVLLEMRQMNVGAWNL